MPDPIIAPYVPSYAATQPYITPAEYKASPTGVNTSTITPGQSAQVNADSLMSEIINASSWVDVICNQVIAATRQIQAGRYLLRDGQIAIPVDCLPVVQVNGWSTGSPGALTVATDLTGTQIDGNVVTIPYAPSREFGGYGTGRVYVELDYVAGYANALLAADTIAGATAITVNSTVGMVPGLPLRIYEPGVEENVTVLSVVGSTVNLSGPMAKAHTKDSNVSALPGVAKQATILLVSALIKGRGAQSIIMQGMQGTPSSRLLNTVDGTEEVERAVAMLSASNLRRVA